MNHFLPIAIFIVASVSFAQPTHKRPHESSAAAAAFVDDDSETEIDENSPLGRRVRVLNPHGEFGPASLLEAAAKGDVAAIRAILDDGRFLAPGVEGVTATHIAAQYGHLGVLRMLLSEGFKSPADNGITALDIAVAFGQLDALRMLLADGGERMAEPMHDGTTALHTAVWYGEIMAMRLLLKDGRFLTPRADGLTALHLAARTGNRRAVLVFILHFRTPEPFFGAGIRETIANDPGVSEEIKELIRRWEQPEWDPAHDNLYPLQGAPPLEAIDNRPGVDAAQRELPRARDLYPAMFAFAEHLPRMAAWLSTVMAARAHRNASH